MAGRIAGITIEIGGDTSNLQKSLKSVDSQLKTTQANLKDINKLLKLDPGNTELLRQKQKELEAAISQTKDRLQQLKEAQAGVAQGTPEWDRLQREIIETENNLKGLEDEYKEFGSVTKQQLQAIGSKLQETGSKISDFGQKLAPLSGAAAALGTALIKLGTDAGLAADDLNTLAKQTGFSTATLQKMQYAADLIDVSVEDMTGALRKLKPKLTEDNEALKELGVATTDTNGNLRGAEEVFFDVVQALSQIENGTERDQIAMELFGKSADSLAGIIDDGGQALRDYGTMAEELGIILDQETLDSLNAANDIIDETKLKIRGTMAVIGSKVLPVITPILEKGAALIGTVAEKLNSLNEEQTATILKVIGVVAAAAPAIILIGKIVSGIGTLVSAAGSLLGVLGNPAVLIITALVAAGVLLYKNWDTIKATAERVRAAVVAAWTKLRSSVVSTMTAVRTSVTGAWNTIRSRVTATVNGLRTSISNAWNGIKSGVQRAVEDIKSAMSPLKEAVNSLKTAWASAWDAISSKVSSIGTAIKTTIDSIKDKFQPFIDLITKAVKGLKELGGAGGVAGNGIASNGTRAGNAVSGGVTINVYAAAGQSAKEIANEVQRILVNQQMQRNRAYA